MNDPISSFFGFEPAPETPDHWHALLVAGFDQRAFKHCADSLGLTYKALAQALGLPRAPHKGERLSCEQSNRLYGIVCAVHAHRQATRSSVEHAWRWLCAPHPGLKNETPLALTASTFGRDYVLAAASRL